MDNWISARVHMLENTSAHELELLTDDGMVSLAVVLGSSLSLVGLVFAFITYSLFSDLRSVAGTTLMNLLASLFLTQLLFVVGAGGVQDSDLCVSLALALHYFRLSIITWLLIATYDFYKTVKAQAGLLECPPPKLASSFLKYSLFGWGSPAIFLSLAILLQDGALGLRAKNCWFPSKNTFIFSFLLPYALIFILNVFYIVKAIYAIRLEAAFAPSRKAQIKLSRRRRLQLLLFARLLIYLTLVFSCGSLHVILNSNLPFIIFAVGASLQGIFIALSVTCNCTVLKLYTRTIGYIRNGRLNYGIGGIEMTKSGSSANILTWDPLPDTV